MHLERQLHLADEGTSSRIDTAHTVTIASPTTQETVITSPHIPGLELALRTKILLENAFAQPLTLPRIAEAVGCSRTTLIEQFTAAFGLPPAEYLARVRIREGLRRLRHLSEPVETAATEVGYRSGNKFYARMRRYADVTPSEARQMTEPEFGQLLEDRISLRGLVRERHHAAKLPIAAVAADRRRGSRRSSMLEGVPLSGAW